MLIKKAHDLVSILAGKNIAGSYKPSQIDKALNAASSQLFSELIELAETSNKYSRLLDPFKQSKGINATKGIVQLPDDFHHDRLMANETNGKEIVKVLDQHWLYRKNRKIGPPSLSSPIYKLENYGDKLVAKVLPETVTKVELMYYKLPKEGIYGFSLNELDQYIYDPNKTTDLEWNDLAFIKLVSIALRTLGVNLREKDLVQYSELIKN